MKKFILFITLTLFSSPALAGKECTCSYEGAKVPEGQSACIKTNKGLQMAQCSRVLNNTSWKFLGVPCPSASLEIDINQTNFDMKRAKDQLAKSG